MNQPDHRASEQQISALVKCFYDRANQDPSLQPIFAAAIHDWDAHHRIVENFWSRVLLDTDRYHGSPYSLHARLPLQLEHFERWLTLFRQTAQEILPPAAAAQAIARAEHMAESFKMGMFFDYRAEK